MDEKVGRLRTWWWDLPLRRKGWLVVGLPISMVATAIVISLTLDARQEQVRVELRPANDLKVLAADIRQHLLGVENDVLLAALGMSVPDDDIAAGRADLEADLAAMQELANGDIEVLVGEVAQAIRPRLAELDQALAAAATTPTSEGGAADIRVSHAGGHEVEGRLDRLTQELDTRITENRERIDRLSWWSLWVLVGGIVVAASTVVFMISLFTRSVVRRIATVSAVTARVLDGDFNIELDSTGSDELGVLFGQLRDAGGLLIRLNDDLTQVADKERRRLERERQLRDVLRTVYGQVGRGDILHAAVRELGATLDADRALVMAVDDGRMGAIIAEWAADGLRPLGVGRRLPTDQDRDLNLSRIIGEQVAIVVDEVADADELLPQTREVLGTLGIGSLLLAPVVGENGPQAVIVLMTAGRTRPWSDGAERLVRTVAGEVATALAHARLLEREQEMVERLRELDQTRADFVASVSHELRTPLTSIRGYVEMLEDGDGGELGDDQRQMLRVVQRNTDRLLSLIEDLLTLSRIEAGSFRVVLAPTDLAALVRRVVDELAPQAAGRGVTLKAEIAPGIPSVLGEAQQLERILLNLLSNAIKFTPDGGDAVVALRQDGDDVMLTITDQGIGIPESELPHLFGRFFRSSNAQERAIQGTGLGLVIVKSIIDHHHGRIDVSSTLGEGTTVTVWLPVAHTPAPVREPVGVA